MKFPKFFPNPISVYGFLTEKTTDWKPKVALILAMLYIISPFDFDWVPILGWIDDAFIGTLAMWYVNHATNNWQVKRLAAGLSNNKATHTVDTQSATVNNGLDSA